MTTTSSAMFAVSASVCWAFAPLIAAPAVQAMGARRFAAVRTAIAALVVGFSALLVAKTAPSPHDLLVLAISSLFGIALGDSLLFYSMKVLGPRRSIILYSTSMPMTCLVAWTVLDEGLGMKEMTGIALCCVGVVVAVAFRESTHLEEVDRRSLAQGVAAGLGAALCQAVGIVAAKPALAGGVEPLTATALRLGLAAIVLVSTTFHSAAARRSLRGLSRETVLRTVTLAVFGTSAGILLVMMALREGRSGATSALSSLAPMFMLPLIALFSGRSPRRAAWLGAGVAVIGMFVVVG